MLNLILFFHSSGRFIEPKQRAHFPSLAEGGFNIDYAENNILYVLVYQMKYKVKKPLNHFRV